MRILANSLTGTEIADPKARKLRLPLAKARRKHLHRIFDSDQLDTTHKTDRVGSPFTLVLTKTSASFKFEMEAYQLDIRQFEQISQIQDWHQNLKSKPTKRKTKPAKKVRKGKA